MRRAVLSLLTGLLFASAASAAPLALDGPDAADRLAAAVKRYGEASRVTWVVSVADPAERAVLMTRVAGKLADAPALIERVRAETAPRGAPTTAHIAVAPAGPADCSWQVTVNDPAAPAPDDRPLAIPLARGDRIPASPDATFQVGFAGPLQSTLYAFGETDSGRIRDLAAYPEIAIPVEETSAETLVLVRARRAVPYLDGIRTALAATPGQRGDLGAGTALVQRFQSRSRGIGALIQLFDPKMVVAEAAAPAPPEPAPAPEPQMAEADLMETCLYGFIPSAGM